MIYRLLKIKVLIISMIIVITGVSQGITSGINIIPKPQSLELRDGTFTIDGNTKIIVTSDNDMVKKIAVDFGNKLDRAKHSNIQILVGDCSEISGSKICFNISKDQQYGAEGYSLDISQQGIDISASQPAGLFYAIQTIYQLLPYQIFAPDAIGSVDLTMPCLYIYDKPRFSWRGNMLDASRHFISVDYIKQNLDYLASLKMNKFHWHLTDDQGWRIEIDEYPKLTDIGAWRVNRNNEMWHDRQEQQPDENPTYGGYYTKDEIREIIQYAKDRFIEIIPEIDMPGHSRAAIAAYPEISCDGIQRHVATGGIMSENTYCPGKEVTFEFTEKMLGEVMELFPSKYMHIGGDECNKSAWKVCDDCQKRISDNNLKDEDELQSYFIKRVEKIVNAQGKLLIGWDEILEGGLAPNAVVMSWRGTHGGIVAAKAGHDVVMSPGSHCYLDLRQGSPDIEPDYGYGRLLLSTAYSFNPIPEGFTDEEAKHILGVQGNLWGESMQRPFDHNYMLFPRLFAISEVGWTDYSLKDYDNFIDRVEYAFNRLDEMGVNYAPSMYNVTIDHYVNDASSDLYFSLSTDINNAEIHYTLDGSNPGLNSEVYTNPIPVLTTSTITAQSYRNSIPVGRISEKEIVFHKASGRKVRYTTDPNPKYNTSELCLTDCLRGTTEHLKETWAGFQGSDMKLEIDLGEQQEISTITVSLLHSTGSWIFLPVNVIFEVSSDGNSWVEVANIDFSEQAYKPGKFLKEAMASFDKRKVSNIRITAVSMKKNPEWHSAAGGSNWIFCDEVIVK